MKCVHAFHLAQTTLRPSLGCSNSFPMNLCLLFLAVEEKSVGRNGFRLKKGMDAVCEAHTLSAQRNLSARSACPSEAVPCARRA